MKQIIITLINKILNIYSYTKKKEIYYCYESVQEESKNIFVQNSIFFQRNVQSAKVVLTAGWCPKLVDTGLILDYEEDHPISRNGIRYED